MRMNKHWMMAGGRNQKLENQHSKTESSHHHRVFHLLVTSSIVQMKNELSFGRTILLKDPAMCLVSDFGKDR